MKALFLASTLIFLGACASTQGYGPASKPGAAGYQTQRIEPNRFNVSYTARDATRSRELALLRAAEVALENEADWFEVTHSYTDSEAAGGDRPRTSVSVGGSVGSGGYSGGGVGIGIGLPVGGGHGAVTTVLEIVTGQGPKPDGVNAYDARSVASSLRDTPQ